MEYQINHTKYIIHEFPDGFAWVSSHDEGPCFPTALEALQHAINNERLISSAHEQELADRLEAEIYGTFEKQVNELWKSTRL